MVGCLATEIADHVAALTLMHLYMVFFQEISYLFAGEEATVSSIQSAESCVRLEFGDTCEILPHSFDCGFFLSDAEEVGGKFGFDDGGEGLVHGGVSGCLASLELGFPFGRFSGSCILKRRTHVLQFLLCVDIALTQHTVSIMSVKI